MSSFFNRSFLLYSKSSFLVFFLSCLLLIFYEKEWADASDYVKDGEDYHRGREGHFTYNWSQNHDAPAYNIADAHRSYAKEGREKFWMRTPQAYKGSSSASTGTADQEREEITRAIKINKSDNADACENLETEEHDKDDLGVV